MARILVIDDEEDLRSLLRLMLTQAGHEVFDAANGEDGLKLYRATPADLIITDILMPGKGGLDLLVELHRDYPQARVIAISGGFNAGGLSAAPLTQVLGVQRTLHKPFTHDDLLKAVDEVLKS